MNKDVLLCIVVEDEPLAQRILENYIQRVGELELVAKCENIEEAYAVLKLEEVDVVFLDLQLESTSGTELISKMNQIPERRYYIVITSARSLESFEPKYIFNQNHIVLIDYLTKPFSFTRFHNAVQKILEKEKSK